MSGEYERACEALAKGEPESLQDEFARCTDGPTLRWALLFVEVGDLDAARAIGEHLEADDASALGQVLDVDRAGHPNEEELEELARDRLDVQAQDERTQDAHVVSGFLRWFGGRRDLYARQWHDNRRRRGGYRPVREPLDADVARRHLAGDLTLGQYPLYRDGTVAFGVLDLDLSPSARAELSAAHSTTDPLHHRGLRSYAERLRDTAQRLSLPLAFEDSGGKGVHAWLFFEPRVPARAARQLLGQIVEAVGGPPPDVSLEVFPKQDQPGPRGLSSLVKLPLGVHRATLRRCYLLDSALQPLKSPAEALAALRTADPAIVAAVLGRRIRSLPLPSARCDSAPPIEPAPMTLAESLRALAGSEAAAATDRIVEGCAQLRELVRHAYEERSLEPAQARAIIYSLGIVGREPTVARDVLLAAGSPMRELHRVQRGLPSPVGCRRLQALGGSSRCADCSMLNARVQPYATPALRAVEPSAHQRVHAPWLDASTLAPEPIEELADAVVALDARVAQIETRGSATSSSEDMPK